MKLVPPGRKPISRPSGIKPIPRPLGPRPFQPGPAVNPVRPGIQQQGIQIINGVKQLPTVGPQPGTSLNPAGFRRDLPFVSGVGPGVQQPLPPMQPSSQIDPSSSRSLRFASAVGPSMQGVGPTQAAPVQTVPAMKKGGMVRGGRKETKGLRKAKLY